MAEQLEKLQNREGKNHPQLLWI